MACQVLLARPAQKQLGGIPHDDYRRIYDKLRNLADTPRPYGCAKLGDDLYRIRCGAYRIIYSILDEEKTVLIVKVARRSEKTYRNLA
ncbi:MAG: type II toxin-antitoxin system RelE/ParE family toxin [Elusimicrobia bacterium]|nr:type II toxin-antitoxin system RelE/ParE family toxin [Elusimicrobiota bacterium]